MSRFQPSINIIYDTGKPELFEQFVPNINQLDIIENIMNGIIKEEVKSHLLIGPYGAGKSMVGALIASLLFVRINSKMVKGFYENVKTVSPESYESLSLLAELKNIRWIPITITGKNGEFGEIIIDSIIEQLRTLDILISVKGDGEQIIKTVSLWKSKYNKTYKKFESLCGELGISVNDILQHIKNDDDTYITEFKKMYPHLTSGADFISDSTTPFMEQIEYICSQLVTKRIGIFIVYDEFGRFLQTVNQSFIYQTMQDLQDLAEIANRSSNIGLMFITHTGLRQYAATNNSLSQSELERVEKRFMNHRLESDPALFYRTAFKIMNSVNSISNSSLFLLNDIADLKGDLLKYNLFPQMSPGEIDGTILEGCQPIHPLTIRLLPVLSNILGQNDRTLYTFLSEVGNKQLGITWYYADQLFDYFYPDESSFYLIDDLKFYRLAMSYQLSSPAMRVVKLITLLNISNRPFKIDKGFLKFALGLSLDEIESILLDLNSSKLVRYNRIAESYELYSGSIIEFESLFKEYRQTIIINDDMRLGIMDEIIDNKFYLPVAYNNTKSMIRFVEAVFRWGVELESLKANGDGELVYLLYRNINDYNMICDSLKKEAHKNILFCIPNLDIEMLERKIDKFIVLQNMFLDKEIINQDENLKSEIEISLENIKFDIEQTLSPIKTFDPKLLKWFFRGEEIESFRSRESLEVFLSEWMYERYPDTLEVRNEGFNKKNITAIQKRSAIAILEQLINPNFKGNFSIEGFGPDYLIYATLLKNQDYNFKNLDELKNEQLRKMRMFLSKYIKKNPRGKVLDLYKILLEEPFGIRAPLVPILTVALLKDYWNQMAFYANDFYVSEMNASLLYEILDQEVDFYEYDIYQLSKETLNTLSLINEVYFQDKLPLQPEVLFNGLILWLRGLPRYTQITNKQTTAINKYKEAIRHSETDPLEAIYRVERLLDTEDKDFLMCLKENLELYLDISRKELYQQVLKIFNVTDLSDWFNRNLDTVNNNPILLNIKVMYESNENWLDYLIEKIVGVNFNDWSDITYDSFISNLNQFLSDDKDKTYAKVVRGDQTIVEIKDVDLSVKGKTIYNNLNRIIQSSGRTMSPDEVKYILYKILTDME